MNLLKYDSKIMYDVLLPMIKNRRYLNVVMTTYGIYIYGHDLFVRITMGEPMPASRACEPVQLNISISPTTKLMLGFDPDLDFCDEPTELDIKSELEISHYDVCVMRSGNREYITSHYLHSFDELIVQLDEYDLDREQPFIKKCIQYSC